MGPQGNQGPRGIGDIGPQGPAGPVGAQGLRGERGIGLGFTIVRIIDNATVSMPSNGNSVIQVVSAGRSRVTITLPAAAAAAGRFVVIKRSERGRPIVVRTAGNDRIDATQRELRLEDARDTLTLVSDGTEWVLLSLID
jgi:hypothetical protein